MIQPIRIGVVGLGKIAQDQHLPAIQKSPAFELAFIVDRAVELELKVPWFHSLAEALNAEIEFDAVAICTSPQVRHELVELLLPYRRAILLEKPAASSFKIAEKITRSAIESGSNVFAAWHSRFAPQVAVAKAWVQENEICRGEIEWRENALKWHPGQDWIWRHGGYGVFDPGINALSILTELTSRHWRVESSRLEVPKNVETPTRAEFQLVSGSCRIDSIFEFHDRDENIWDIRLTSKGGSKLSLTHGGAKLSVDGRDLPLRCPRSEYERVYDSFSTNFRENRNDCDLIPMRLVEEVFANSETVTLDPISI